MDTESAVTDAIAALVTEARQTKQLPEPAQRRQIREDAGVSVRRLARALDVDPMTVIRWEDGATPRPGTLVRYREALDGLRGVAP